MRRRVPRLSERVFAGAGTPTLVAVAALAAYLATVAPSVAVVHDSADSAELVTVASVLGVAHPPGAAIWLPLGRIALAVLAFLPEPALRTNVLSAVCMAGAGALTVVVTRRALPHTPRWAAALAGVLFATAPIVWAQALITEVLALQALLSVAALLCALRCMDPPGEAAGRADAPHRSPAAGRWALFGFVLGLLCWNHPTGVVLAIALVAAVAVDARPAPRAVGVCLAAFLVPAAFSIAYLVLRADATVAWGDTGTAGGLWAHLSGAQYRGLIDTTPTYIRESLPATIRLTLRQLPPLLWPAIPVGALAAWHARPALTAALLGHAAVTVGFVAVYRATGREDYLEPVVLTGAWFGASGSVVSWRWFVERARPGDRRARLAIAGSAIALLVAWAAITASQVSLRGESAELASARALLESQPPGATLASGRDELTFPLWYLRVVKHERPDVAIVDVRGFAPVIAAEPAPR